MVRAIPFIVIFEYLGPGIALFSINLLYLSRHCPYLFF